MSWRNVYLITIAVVGGFQMFFILDLYGYSSRASGSFIMVFEPTFPLLAFVGPFKLACGSMHHSSKLLLGVFTSFYVFLLLMCDSSVNTGKYLYCHPSLLTLNGGGDNLNPIFCSKTKTEFSDP